MLKPMRYVIDREFREPKREKANAILFPFATTLRRELSERNLRWAFRHGHAHEVSMGNVPAVLYREDESGNHGNFLPETYRQIKEAPDWSRRLAKVHTSARRVLLSHDSGRNELDSSNSSDALLMNVFCHQETLASPGLCRLLGIDQGVRPVFGHRPGIPVTNGRRDCTEVDMILGDLIIEAKLTEYDFQSASSALAGRYRDLETVFDRNLLQNTNGVVTSYQLIRGVLAAHGIPGGRFCVLCDRRRPDLIDAWHLVMMAVKSCDLRCRLQILTWQELAAALPMSLRFWLGEKYGIGD